MNDLAGYVAFWPRLLYVGSFFIVFLILCHLYIYVKHPDARFLKKIDYVWLGFASLSIISAVSDQSRLLASNTIGYASNYLISATDPFTSDIHFTRRLYCETPWQVTGEQAVILKNDCTWFEGLEKSIEVIDRLKTGGDEKKTIRAENLAPLIQTFTLPQQAPANLSQEIVDLNNYLDNAKKETDNYNHVRSTLEDKTELETAIALLLPYLVSIALALRVAKVTGELRL
jgi:hypothetical protein